MQYFGFGYNGFGQLIQQSQLSMPQSRNVSAIDTAVKILTETTFGDDTCVTNDDVSMVTSSWSLICICREQEVHLQGFIKGKKNEIQSYSSTVPILDILLTEEDLVILMEDGKSCKVIKYTSTLRENKIMQIRYMKDDEDIEECVLKHITYSDTHMVAVTGGHVAGELEIKDDSYMIFKPITTNIAIKQVSCGKEHVMLLSCSGDVFSYGLGSRGQLGHGTTEPELAPRVIEALQGVAIATVATGGWHSAAVSSIGDLYMWGWNESGQLGLPMKDPPEKDTESKCGMLGVPIKDPLSLEQKQCPETIKKISSTDNEISTDEYRKIQCSENTLNVKDAERTVTMTTAGSKRKGHDLNCKDEDKHEKHFGCLLLKEEKLTSKQEDVTDSATDQDTVILCQTLPCLMEFPTEVNVSKVSCGSRHTAALTDIGDLYTWGWNQYGQLGQSNNTTTDVITLVSFFKQHALNIKDIHCGPWNTIVTVKTK